MSTDDVRQIAEDAYAYGLQQVIFYGTRFNYTQNRGSGVFEGVNRWSVVNGGEPIDHTFRSIVTPNATTAYAIGFLDLQAEPVVIDMPEVTDRYFGLQLMDPYRVFWLYAGNQFNGTAARSYLILGEDDDAEIPWFFATTDIVKTPSRTLTVIVRYARTDPESEDERSSIKFLLDQTRVTPLSKWLANDNKGLSRDVQEVVVGDYPTFPRMSELTTAQVDNQTAEDFFTYLHLVLNDPTMTLIKDSKSEAEILHRLASLGVGRGLDFDWSQLDVATQDALAEGFKSGYDGVKRAAQQNMINMNGWMIGRNDGGFQTDWETRALMADFGWLGPDRNISHGGALGFFDADGQPLNGEYGYTLTFEIDNLPPVTEFWSLPIYDADGYFVANEINRYSINSFQLEQGLLRVDDDKLTIYIQHKKPADADKAVNWLPSPPDGFRFTPRFYGPKYSLIDGTYNMPKVQRVS